MLNEPKENNLLQGSDYASLSAKGLTEEELHQRMNEAYREQVTQLLQKEDWHLKENVGIYQDYENPHLWNVYDNEPNSRPTKWTFNTNTNQLQKRV